MWPAQFKTYSSRTSESLWNSWHYNRISNTFTRYDTRANSVISTETRLLLGAPISTLLQIARGPSGMTACILMESVPEIGTGDIDKLHSASAPPGTPDPSSVRGSCIWHRAKSIQAMMIASRRWLQDLGSDSTPFELWCTPHRQLSWIQVSATEYC
ncbi:hypothetical protein B5807_00998 [Epicoccum nigrum]|uniref:Uncharacterized protein n=1 Tax=Epicoccum nigrum TaxID=105696 RepID=A0A1Y2MH22_EPING|nr:hypothetical protein B5807_00998 [Epicoccum nigrum]